VLQLAGVALLDDLVEELGLVLISCQIVHGIQLLKYIHTEGIQE